MIIERQYLKLCVIAMLIGSTTLANAFSLLGPLSTPATAWQVPGIGLSRPGDIGNPENIGEEYRWNVPDITYAFDDGFLNYFGLQGVQAVEEAIGILNNIGPVSSLSPDLSEFPIEALRRNESAGQLGVRDLKSTALSFLLELLGLAQSDRYVYVIRNRTVLQNPTRTNYFIIHRNFDPVTYEQSESVNQAAFLYTIVDPIPPDNWADVFEFPASQPPPSSLSAPVTALRTSGFGSFAFGIGSGNGVFATGLSRDDVGGLRYIYRAQNYNVENPSPDVTLTTNGVVGNIVSPWIPYFGITNLLTNVFGTTNITATNTLITTYLRPGIETITFVRTDFDSLLGQTTIPITNIYTDVVISNNTALLQRVQRITTQPDIVFTAEDLGFNAFGFPFLVSRGVNFINNDGLNGSSVLAGPGVLSGPARISFTNLLPGYFATENTASGPDPLGFDKVNSWGWFGESDSLILFPNGFSLQELEQLVLPP